MNSEQYRSPVEASRLGAIFAVALRHQQNGTPAKALAAYRAALCVMPNLLEGHYNRGNALADLGNPIEAAAAFAAALRLKPDFAKACFNLGNALRGAARSDEAVSVYRRAVCIEPGYGEAYFNLGATLQELGRLDPSVRAYGAALRLVPCFTHAHANLGVALKELGCSTEAAAAQRRALCLEPGNAMAYANQGNIERDFGRLDDALAAYRVALRLDPDFAEAHVSLGNALLLRGRFEEGWVGYEWRLRGAALSAARRAFAQPVWQGEALQGRTILLHAEQGMGDAIQFCRYVPLVSAKGGSVILEVHRPLLRLLSGLAGADQIVAAGDPLPVFDVHCPLMSLPRAFGTRLETIPARVPYLAAEPDRVASWRDRLPSSGFRIGIVWQGARTYKSDRDRSIPLACFAPLARIPGVRLISLQKGYGLDQLARLPDGMSVEILGEDFDAGADAFLDSAAVMMSLDLIVTVDTAIGHLAGALGRPVWLPLATVPHWPWMMEREDSPWYPNTRLFRQKIRGDWQDVFERMALRLNEIA